MNPNDQMSEINYDEIGLKVGLEIHQQLDTKKKLFCNCKPEESEKYTSKFSRKLRISKSEMGSYDPAALFEKSKAKTIVYYANSKSSCLVEHDEEPPHNLDPDAKMISLQVAFALKSHVFDEIFPMRKMVIDGSNTSGFQRTMLISQGGVLEANEKTVGVQSICLEEDAAKLIKDSELVREYSLDRLGIPLIEIALEPVSASPYEMKKIALTLGRLLRTTKKVRRGLGSIRQDVNVSIMNSGVVEVKGVQQLDQLEKVIEYEAKRQHGLLLVKEKLKGKSLEKLSKDENVFDVSEIMKDCKSKIIQKALKEKAVIKAVKIKNFAGMFSYSPYEGIRLGKELGQLVRFFGIGGIFHSDELPSYGIGQLEVENIIKFLRTKEEDGFFIIASEPSKIDYAIESIVSRIEDAKKGIPAETRLATQTGETVFLRPKPGAARMYPETDVPPIIISDEELEFARKHIPPSWDVSLENLQKKYKINPQLAEQIFDSDYLDLFEKISTEMKISPNFVASILCSTLTNLERRGLDGSLLRTSEIMRSFELLDSGKITKESLEIIFEDIMSGKSHSVEEAIQKISLSVMGEKELKDEIEIIVNEHEDLIIKQGFRSMGPLMGIVMKKLRGKASGEKINQILQKRIQSKLDRIK